jgi:hypothetical protein
MRWIALVLVVTVALAQHSEHSGMDMSNMDMKGSSMAQPMSDRVKEYTSFAFG